MTRPPVRSCIVGALLLVAGCRSRARAVPVAVPESTEASASRIWSTTRETSDLLARRGEQAQADSLLTDFRTRFPGTPAGSDALFRRALLRADPAAATFASGAAVSDLAAYEAGGDLQPYVFVAGVLRRLLTRQDSLRLALASERGVTVVIPPTFVPRDSLKVRDDEIVRLHLELDQTRAELDRVRRRLAPPRRP